MSTFAQLKTNVNAELGLDSTASGAEDVLLGVRLNEGVREVLLRTHCKVSVATTALTAGTADYELPTDVLAMHEIKTSALRSLERENPATIHSLRQAAATATAAYTFLYALDGANLLMLYPTPSASDVLTLYYVPKPTEMSAAGNDPSTATYGGIPVQWHDALELWAMHKLGSYDDDASSKIGSDYLVRFEQRVREIRLEIKNMGGRRQPRVRVNRYRPLSSDPSRT